MDKAAGEPGPRAGMQPDKAAIRKAGSRCIGRRHAYSGRLPGPDTINLMRQCSPVLLQTSPMQPQVHAQTLIGFLHTQSVAFTKETLSISKQDLTSNV